MAYPTIRVEAAFTVGGAFGTALVLDNATTGKLDTGTLSAEVWTDITAYATAFSTRRGASRAEGPILRFEAGTCSVTLDNADRRFDPTNLSGPYVSAGKTQVTPMRSVRILATYNGTEYPIFRGYADSWDISYDEPAMSTCVLTATDATKVLSNVDRAALATAVGEGESSGERIHRVLDSASWPLGPDFRAIDPGKSTLQSTTMDRSAWEEMLKVQDSEIGAVFVDGAGRVVFRNRHANLESVLSTTVQGNFGDGLGLGAWILGTGVLGSIALGVSTIESPFEDAVIVYDDDGLANVVRIANVGGNQQVAEDVGSQRDYLIHTYERTDLILQTDTEAATYAAFVLFAASEPELRFTSLSVMPHDDPDALFPQVLGREFGDRVRLTRRPPPGGDLVSRDSFIVGVTHEVSGPNQWRTTWALQSATKVGGPFLTLDNAASGVLDSTSYPLAF